MRPSSILLSFFLLLFLAFTNAQAINERNSSQSTKDKGETENTDKLVVLWTSGDPEVAKKMVFMYVYNAKKAGWWEEVTFIIWGPSSRLLAEDEELQGRLQDMKETGINLEACKACADQYGVSGKLEDLGVDVKYMGEPLTKYIKQNYHVITF